MALPPSAGLASADDRLGWREDVDHHVATAWFGQILELVRGTPGFTPPVAARALGYAGVALHQAMGEQGRGRHGIDDALAANAALATAARGLFSRAPSALQESMTALEHQLGGRERHVPAGIAQRSRERGVAAATRVLTEARGRQRTRRRDAELPL
jgi:hypothetical protein